MSPNICKNLFIDMLLLIEIMKIFKAYSLLFLKSNICCNYYYRILRLVKELANSIF